MKQAQYRGAARSSGFRPVQISGNEIARMREESSRVVQGMREQREAEIKERERIQADEQKGQQIETRLRERNRQVETANHQRALTGLQQEARATEAQYQQNLRDNTSILKGISTLSESAGKIYSEYVEAEEDKIISKELEDYLNNPNDHILEASRSELGLDILDEVEQQQLDEYAVNGGDPLVVAKKRNYSDRVRREILKGKAAYFYQYKYSQLLDEAIKAEEDRLGRKLENDELAAFMTDVGRVVADKFRTEGGMTLKPGSMRTALEYREQIHQRRLTGARQSQIEVENAKSIDDATSILLTNPGEFANNISKSYRAVYRANGYDHAKAHDWYEGLYTARGPDGEFLFSEEELASTVLEKGQKPYALERPNRHLAGLMARQKADNEYRQLAIKAENLAYKEAEQQTLQYIAENNSKAVVDSAASYFIKTYGKVPESIVKFQENYTHEAQAKAKQITLIKSQAIPGFIQKEQVEALKALDYQEGKQLEEQYNLQEQRYRTGIYKNLSDAFKSTANGVTAYGNLKPNEAASLALQRGMRAEFRRRVDRAVGQGADFNTAAELTAKQIEDEVKLHARGDDPDALFYRKPNARPGGSAEFPNLYSQANLTDFEKARRSFQALERKINDDGIEKTLDTAESILTRDEIISIKKGFGKPGFTIPTDVLSVSGLGNGLDPFTIINRQIKALGDPDLQPLEVPPVIRNIEETLTREQRGVLYNLVSGPMQKMRALHSGYGNQLGLRAGLPGVVPSTQPAVNPREVYDYMIELGVSDIHAKAMLANIMDESGFKPDAVGDNGMSGGFWQMYNDRFRKMELAVPDWKTNWKGQVKHALSDDRAPEFLSMQFNSAEEAADWFMENWERPAVKHRAQRRKNHRTFIPSLGF